MCNFIVRYFLLRTKLLSFLFLFLFRVFSLSRWTVDSQLRWRKFTKMLRKSARQQFGVLSRRSARFQNHAKKNIFSVFFFRGKFFDEDFSLKLQFSFSFTFFWPMNNFLEKIRKYFCEFFACVFGMCVVVIVAAAAFLCRLCSNSLHLNCVYREATRSPFAFAGYFSHIYS